MKTGKYFNCQTCNKEFYRAPWQIVRSGEEKQKFCSLSCRRHTDEGRKNMALKKIGKPSWNNGNVQTVTLGGNRTFTFANPKSGARYSIIIKQDATGSRTVTWPAIKWAGGTTPTLTTTANKYDIVTFIYDGTSYFGTISTNF